MLAIGAILISIWFFNSAKYAKKSPYLWVTISVKYLSKINPVFSPEMFEDLVQRSPHRFETLVGLPR